MAIIYSYPEKTTPAGNDFLVITDSEQPAPNKNRTKSLTIDNLADYVVTSTSGITGSGTLNTIAMFTPTGSEIGDSIITQAALGQGVTINGALDVVEDLNVTGTIETSSNLGVNGTTTLYGPLEVNSTYYDASGDEGTDGDVLVAKGTPGNMITRWVSKANTDIATGSGTTNVLPMWTDGPNGVLGDSFITQEVFAPGTGSEESRITISNPSPGPGSNGNFLIVNTGRFGRIETDRILASDTGSVTMNGNVNIGNASTDELNILSTTNIWNAKIKTGVPFGFFAPDEDYVLTSTVGSTLVWTSKDDYVSGAISKLIPFTITASPGGSSTYSADNNIVEIGWTVGNGTYVLNIPSAATIPYRNIRFVTNSTFPNGASDKVEITAQPGETIDGAAFFEISKRYEGVSLWSNGTEWIVIQAKAH